ncbi:MAG: hypothetical protein HY752_03825 [Nitrospirae bacterium]|nr:hypothetical protein [Nitrospirota bacterium]
MHVIADINAIKGFELQHKIILCHTANPYSLKTHLIGGIRACSMACLKVLQQSLFCHLCLLCINVNPVRKLGWGFLSNGVNRLT